MLLRRKRLASILLSAFILASAVPPAEAAPTGTDDRSEYGNGEILVMYEDGDIEVIRCESDGELAAELQALSANGEVAFYQPNYTYHNTALSVNDALAGKQWALLNDGSFRMQEQQNEFPVFDDPFGYAEMPGQWRAPLDFGRPGGRFRMYAYRGSAASVSAKAGIDIGAEKAWSLYRDSGKEVTVALIDTGIDYTHEDLKGRIWTNSDEIANNGVDDDGNGYIDDVYGWNFYQNNNNIYTGSDDDHGTHGAGTVAAIAGNGTGIAGIAQSEHIKVMGVKALGGRDGSGSTASVVRAIRYAEANGASICNLSLGTSYNDRALYQTIANSNMLFVIAAGNNGQNIDKRPSYPASYDLENIIAVGNLNYDGTLHYSSDYGAGSVDLAAPGSYILSTTSGNSYSYMTGTSMSAPFVSGAAALVYSHYGDISLSAVKEILLSSVKPLDSLQGSVKTGGMLDLGSALQFDRNGLSGEEWTPKTPYEYKGKPPQIAVRLTNQRNKSYLTVQFYDEDGDLTLAAYAEGTLDAAAFDGGKNGKPITLSGSGSATFEATEGVYTFYASDAGGNETVKTVEITRQNSRNAFSAPDVVSFPRYGFGDFGMPSFFEETIQSILDMLAGFHAGS